MLDSTPLPLNPNPATSLRSNLSVAATVFRSSTELSLGGAMSGDGENKRKRSEIEDVGLNEGERDDGLDLTLSLSSSQSAVDEQPRGMQLQQRASILGAGMMMNSYVSNQIGVPRVRERPAQPTVANGAVFVVAPPKDVADVTGALAHRNAEVASERSARGRRRANNQTGKNRHKSETIISFYPWATDRRATVHSLNDLKSIGITVISGDVQCKRCEKTTQLEFNLEQKFKEVGRFIAENRAGMHQRAPSVWLIPVLPTCPMCDHENSLKPVIAEKKRNINWLFLLLGQMLGCCTLDQLKYFCKHTENHRTGAKDRLLYLAYLSLCKQLYPAGPFNL